MSSYPQGTKQVYCPPVFANNDRLTHMQALFPAIDSMYQQFAEKHHCPGYAYGVMVDGQLAHSGSRGYLDVDKKTPVTTQSMFRIASMTKSFTAMAILKLRDEGFLKLDDPVSLYLPELREQRLTTDSPAITIRDLLTHAAGFPSDNEWADRLLAATSDELIALLEKGIFFSNIPGTAYEYSNLGYAILGYVIEKVSGWPYGKYIDENICKPLGMKQAAWEFTEVPASQLAHGYKWCNESMTEEPLLHDGIFGAMGGMITSIEAFSRFAALHQSAWPPRNDAETGPIKRSSIRELHQPWRFDELVSDIKYSDGRECLLAHAYGYGLHWYRDREKRTYVGHSGGLPGFGSNWFFMPDYGLGIILFTNGTYVPTWQANLSVLDVLIKGAQLKPSQISPSTILRDMKCRLEKLLPEWENAESSGIFALNFFLDHSVDILKKHAKELFAKAGKIISIGDVSPINQLSGYFIMQGEKSDLHVSFFLTPDNPTLIQRYQIKEIGKGVKTKPEL